jgi:small subunit ribosomal protein S17
MVTKKERTTPTEKQAKPANRPAVPRAEAPAAAPAGGAQVDERNALQRRRMIVGTVVSDKMQKTIVVKVDRRVKHSLYKKFVVRSRKYQAHDENNSAKVGDRVTLVESRPMSRHKRWVLQEIVRKASQVAEANV